MRNSISRIDESWTLFLDRDGVINKKLPNDYVKHITDFHFEDGARAAIQQLAEIFKRIIVVTNQQGIGKGLMTVEMLDAVHEYMNVGIAETGGKINRIYYCPNLAKDNAICRKPNTGMAEQARRDFPEIDFKKSIIVGDSISDLQMGRRVGMLTCYIHSSTDSGVKEADIICPSLWNFSQLVKQSADKIKR